MSGRAASGSFYDRLLSMACCCFLGCSTTGIWQPRVGSAVSRALRPQFRDTDQVERRAAEHEQPVHLPQSA
jgi:hypothetical protein